MNVRTILFCGAGLVVSVCSVSAQSRFSTITGHATDITGAMAPDVQVVATHVATGADTRTRSNELGIYTLGNLREGQYVLHATKAGFKDLVVKDILLVSGDLRRVDLLLEVGAVQQTVEVTATVGMIKTDNQTISHTKSFFELTSLPLNSRSLTSFYSVMPLYQTIAGTTQPGFAGSTRGQHRRTFNGAVAGAIGNIVDSNEGFEEMKVDYVNNSAEYGQLAEISVVTKSGQNDLHGSGFWQYGTPAFRASNPFTSARSRTVNHKYGFTAGGPLFIPKAYNGRNRTFWFVEGDTDGNSATRVNLNATVPAGVWRSGDFSGLGIQIRNPLTGAVYADGKIPASAINPVSRKVQERFYPLPNYGDANTFAARNYRDSFTAPSGSNTRAMMRLDHRLSERDSLYASYALYQGKGAFWQSQLPTVGYNRTFRRQKVFNLNYTRTFSPSLLNEARFGYSYNNNPQNPPINGLELVRDLGLQGLAPDLPDIKGIYQLSFSGLGLSPVTLSSNWSNPGFLTKDPNLQETLTYYRGKHSFKIGGAWTRQVFMRLGAPSNLFGANTFANTYSRVPGVTNSGHAYADFLLGLPTSASRGFPPLLQHTTSPRYELYFQDDWKVTPQLTLNLGIRYEKQPHWLEQSGRQSIFDVESGKIVVPDEGLAKVSPLMPKGYVEVTSAGSVGLPGRLLRTDGNNFAPRFGFAYRPFAGSNRTVVRGGYGIYYDNALLDLTVVGVPFSIAEPTFTNTNVPTLVLPQVFPASGVNGPATVSLPVAVNPDLQTPYSQQWNLTMEHERWDIGFRVSYIGTNTRQMWYARNVNAPFVDERLFINKPRRFANYPAINYQDNGANHNYHALNVEAKRRMKNGLNFQSSWTWARDVGDVIWATGITVGFIQNPYDRRAERGPYTGIPTHRWVNYAIYELPFGKGKKWMSAAPRAMEALAGGWMISMIGFLQTGQFLTATYTMPDPTGTTYTTSGNRPLVTIRPDALRDPHISDPSVNRWFDVGAFQAPPIGRFGNSSPGGIIGPGENLWHAGVYKYFKFPGGERAPKLRVDLTAINAFNHPNWNNPNTTVSNPITAGTITGVGGPNGGSLGDKGGPRELQLSLRLEW